MTIILVTAVLALAAGLAAAALVHRADERRRARERYRAQLEAALADGVITPEETRELEALRAETELSDAEARTVALALYRRALREAAADSRVTADEETALARLQRQLELTEADLAADRTQVQRLRLLGRLERGELPEVAPPFPLEAGERCHWVVRGTLCHLLALPGAAGGAEGMRFEVDDDAPFHADGARVPLADRAEVMPLDAGVLMITDRRLVFRGAKRHLSLPHDRLIRLLLHRDGVRLEDADGPDRLFLAEDVELTAAVLLGAARRDRHAPAGDPAARAG